MLIKKTCNFEVFISFTDIYANFYVILFDSFSTFMVYKNYLTRYNNVWYLPTTENFFNIDLPKNKAASLKFSGKKLF